MMKTSSNEYIGETLGYNYAPKNLNIKQTIWPLLYDRILEIIFLAFFFNHNVDFKMYIGLYKVLGNIF